MREHTTKYEPEIHEDIFSERSVDAIRWSAGADTRDLLMKAEDVMAKITQSTHLGYRRYYNWCFNALASDLTQKQPGLVERTVSKWITQINEGKRSDKEKNIAVLLVKFLAAMDGPKPTDRVSKLRFSLGEGEDHRLERGNQRI